MGYEELDRVRVIERVIEKRLTQAEAARILGLTSRQVRRLRRGYSWACGWAPPRSCATGPATSPSDDAEIRPSGPPALRPPGSSGSAERTQCREAAAVR